MRAARRNPLPLRANANRPTKAETGRAVAYAPYRGFVPLPPPRPFTLGAGDPVPADGRRTGRGDQLASILSGPAAPLSFAEADPPEPFARLRADPQPVGGDRTALP